MCVYLEWTGKKLAGDEQDLMTDWCGVWVGTEHGLGLKTSVGMILRVVNHLTRTTHRGGETISVGGRNIMNLL